MKKHEVSEMVLNDAWFCSLCTARTTFYSRIHPFFISCSDEMFLSTVLANFPSIGKLSTHSALYGHLRMIDRERLEKASPHTWTIDDWDMIRNAENCFWARKFNEERDADIIKKVVETWP